MKDMNKRTLVNLWIEEPTEAELMEAAHRMKGGKAYLFKADDGLPVLRHKKGIPWQHQMRKETFVKRLL